MILAPYESSSGSVSDYEKDDENDSVRVEKGEKKDEVSGQLEEIREDFEDGKLDYVEAKKELEEIDVDDLEQTQEKKYDSLVEDLGKGFQMHTKKSYTQLTAFHSILASFSLFLPGSTLQQVLPEETDLSQTKMDLPKKPPQNPAQKYIKSGWLSHIPDNTTL